MRLPQERDYLTGLSNRRSAQKWIAQRFEGQEGTVLILLSISQFDRINAAYGQLAGNALLGRIGRRIGRLIEEEQGGGGVMLARMAGTEFLIGLGSDTATARAAFIAHRSEEHTSELQSLMSISYAVFCLKKKNQQYKNEYH